ncbi:MAG: flagellar biosynthesis protein FliQ [Calditrichia bacterium]
MTQAMVVKILTDAIYLILIIAGPFLLITLFIGLIISIFQAVTSVSEMTLTFIPKILGVIFLFILLLPWIINKFVLYVNQIFNLIETLR